MKNEDRLVIALDVSQEKKQVEQAYLDPTGVSAPLYLNAIWRLNREYGGTIDTEKLKLVAHFEQTQDIDRLSIVIVCAVSTCDQHYVIPGLNLELTLKEGDYLRLHEGEGVSCKYTLEQIKTFITKGNQTLKNIWIDDDKHVSLCCIGKN
ncbi:hypothetical protein ACF0H5_004421 [Mactra antiquata]